MSLILCYVKLATIVFNFKNDLKELFYGIVEFNICPTDVIGCVEEENKKTLRILSM